MAVSKIKLNYREINKLKNSRPAQAAVSDAALKLQTLAGGAEVGEISTRRYRTTGDEMLIRNINNAMKSPRQRASQNKHEKFKRALQQMEGAGYKVRFGPRNGGNK